MPLGDVRRLFKKERDAGARHHDVEDVVRVGRLGDPEQALAGLDELRRDMFGQDVEVQGTAVLHETGEVSDIAFELFAGARLEHDYQVRRGLCRDVAGHAELQRRGVSESLHREDVGVFEY